MKLPEEILAGCPDNKDAAVAYFRSSGLSKVESIGAIAMRFGVGLAEAKNLVHLSPTWDDVRERDEAFHEAIEAALKEAD
ncbi:MAG: hypothetical protein GC203_18995 [Phenylobacterium sp.]|uniref:hypothetical protein n=1 Tax=Phenylobacterium sp. TaxID=1871053 RepID=UPI0025F8FABB|nr:hypothetical protein [Phenylobacterium sp.]MBI1199951.1 hypothetical protein [Phenylobacterium sp.]